MAMGAVTVFSGKQPETPTAVDIPHFYMVRKVIYYWNIYFVSLPSKQLKHKFS